MKDLFRNIIDSRSIAPVLPAVFLLLLTAACRESEPAKWVDLRYKADDAYVLTASNPEPIRLQVKSSDPWSVFGLDPSWCSISPASGGPDEIFDVEVRYTDNTSLDDRLDTITIKSDYWVGKTIPVCQKGIAYIEAGELLPAELPQDGGSGAFTLNTNQSWHIQPDENATWLNIESELSGTGDATIKYSATSNKGERRYANLAVYNRHDQYEFTVTLVQIGVQLDVSENLFKTDFNDKTLAVEVISNAQWSVALEDESQDWISFDQTDYEGSATLNLNITRNPGTSIRNATVVLRTIAVPGVTQVEKRIIIRQANDPVPEHYEFNSSERIKWSVNQGTANFADGDVTFSPGRLLRYHFLTGNYKIRIKSWSDDAISTLYFCVGNFEVRWHLNAARKSTDISVRNDGSTAKHNNVSFDPTQPHEISLNMSQTESGDICFTWLLDGESFNTYAADGSDGGKITVPFGSEFSIFLGCSAGTVTYDWWEYATPYELFNWGD